MGTIKLSTFVPVLLALFVNLVASRRVQSGLLSNLLKTNSYSNNPIVVALDKTALAELDSENLDSDFVDAPERSRSPMVYLYQLGQSKNMDERIINLSQGKRERKQRYTNKQHRNDRHRPGYEHKHNRDRRDRHRNDHEDRYQLRKDRHFDRYSRPLRSDDKNQEQEENVRLQEQEDSDRNGHEHDGRGKVVKDIPDKDEVPTFKNQDSAQAQIPVIKSLLRTLSCNARDECQDTCGGPDKDECEDECEEKYDCKDKEEEEENDSCDSCHEKPSSKRPKCTGSTKGERIVTEAPKCKRC